MTKKKKKNQKQQNKPVQQVSKKPNAESIPLSIEYDKNMDKGEEFKHRIFERAVVRILEVLENRRP